MEKTKETRLVVRMTYAEKEQLHGLAKKNGQKISDFIRKLIDEAK